MTYGHTHIIIFRTGIHQVLSRKFSEILDVHLPFSVDPLCTHVDSAWEWLTPLTVKATVWRFDECKYTSTCHFLPTDGFMLFISWRCLTFWVHALFYEPPKCVSELFMTICPTLITCTCVTLPALLEWCMSVFVFPSISVPSSVSFIMSLDVVAVNPFLFFPFCFVLCVWVPVFPSVCSISLFLSLWLVCSGLKSACKFWTSYIYLPSLTCFSLCVCNWVLHAIFLETQTVMSWGK